MAKTAKQEASIAALIDEYIARGVFRAAAQSSAKKNVESYRIVWFQDQAMILEIDARKKQARLMNVLPTIASRSKLDRELRTWLSERSDKKLPEHRRINPTQLQVKLSNQKGQMQLTMTDRKKDLLFATRKLLHLANELYLDFLSAPERYNWIVETFDLDPDNPKWP